MATRTRSRSAAPASAAAVPAPVAEGTRRSPIRDFTGGASGQVVVWDVRPVYDFLFSLTGDAGETDDIAADDRRWLNAARADLPTEVRTELDRMCETELAVHVASFAIERRELRTAADLVGALEREGPGPLLRAIFSEAVAGRPEAAPILDRAIGGDATAYREFEAILPDWKRTERLALLRDPAGTHARVLGVVRTWAAAWTSMETRIERTIARDYDLRAGDRATLAVGDLIEKTTGGVRWNPEPGVRRVILAPSYFSRPYNFLLAGTDWRFFGYPVADEALEVTDPMAPPPSVVRLHRALGDPTRLRILRLLAEKDLYLTEIAGILDLSKPTIKHHLALLRAAGLVTVLEAGAVMYYSLRRDRLDDASSDLKHFLVG